MAEWFIQLDSGFSRMTARDEKALEETVAAGNNTLEYDWAFQNNDGEMVTTPYRIDLVNMLQINTRTNYERRVLRFEHAGAHAVLSPFCCAMAEQIVAEWFIQLDSGFSRMTARDEKALEETVAAGNNTLEYDWAFQNNDGEMVTTPYRIDLVNMLQINTRTNYERRVLRFEHAGAHAVLSPFRGG